MALRSVIVCEGCKRDRDVYYVSSTCKPSICGECAGKAVEKQRDEVLAAMAAEPLEVRLARLEAFLHDHGLVPHGYQPAPRF